MTGTAPALSAAPLVKICGLTRPEDAAIAAALGAWAIGLVFAPSPRRVTVKQAVSVVAAARAVSVQAAAAADGGRPSERPRGANGPWAVGVFLGAAVGEIVRTVDAAALDAVQLHGPDPAALALRLALGERAADTLIIQTVPVPAEGATVSELQKAAAVAREGSDLVLFDTRVQGKLGGTGATFDWEVVREATGGPFLVAGGIGPHNARLALEASGATGVDVSSAVESAPGVKDENLLRALFTELREGTRP